MQNISPFKQKQLILSDTDLGNFIHYPSYYLGLATFYLVLTLIRSLNLESTKLWSQLPFQICGSFQGKNHVRVPAMIMWD
jgi:hypothetical protein